MSSPPGSRGVRPRRIELRSIQLLRAIAALMVVIYHAADHVDHRSLVHPQYSWWFNGQAGVDVFFVISGIVIILSVQRLGTRRDAGHAFLTARLARIVPMYWLFTTLKLMIALAAPAMVARQGDLGWAHVLGSYLFIPTPDSTGNDMPILEVGWTLTYEMLFYMLVALSLFRRPGLPWLVAPVLGAFAAARWWSPNFGNTIVLEFLYGAAIGLAITQIGRMRTAMAYGVGLLGIVAIAIVPEGSGVLRPFTWGLPAAMIVIAAVGLEARFGAKLWAWVLLLGDASYVLYLCHSFFIPPVYAAALHLRMTGVELLVTTVLGSVILSSGFAMLLHRTLERPLTDWLRRRSRRPALATS